jgi:hydroxyethylthiazole kinase-like uncharacterized protein yjeF
MKLLLASWMKELDSEAIDTIGIPSIVLMENASRGAAEFFAREFPLENNYKNIIVVAGKGNNGGDGIAIGRILHQKGYDVTFVILSNPEKLNPDPRINFNIIKNLNLNYTVLRDDDQSHLEEIFNHFEQFDKNQTVIVDAVFGTGLNNPVSRGIYSRVIELINQSGFKIAAVDIPSGISDAFLPGEGPHVTAHATATFQCLKTAHLHPDGNKYCGKIEIIDIGIPNERVHNDKYYIDIITPAAFKELLEKREIDAHKGTFGHALTIAGSIDKPGAGILSSFSVLKAGAGLCTAAVCYENRTTAVTAHPEIMTLIYKGKDDLLPALEPFNTILAGPGMGDNNHTYEIISALIKKAKVPIVLDADALNVLGKDMKILEASRPYPLVLTPHPGEFSRLTRLPVSAIAKNRIGTGREFAVKYKLHVVLKGHHALVLSPEGRVHVNPTGNPGMATAGSGDVLSGIIAGMVSQFVNKYSLDTILQAAVFIHGFAGDLACKDTGENCLTATDIIRYLPNAFLALERDDYKLPFNIS